MKYIVEMWKRIFDYKGKSGRKEFWIPFAINSAVAFVAFCLVIASVLTEILGFIYPIAVISVYLAISAIPFISLTVRRLHDTGKSGWWYCLIFGFGIGAVVLLFMCAAAIEPFIAAENAATGVYGPPEYFGSYDPSENTEPTVYDPPEDFEDYEPSQNTEPCVYGPPEDFGETEETEPEFSETEPEETELTEETTLAETTTAVITTTAAVTTVAAELPETSVSTEEITNIEPEFSAEENMELCVYGPPEWFDDFDPAENIEEDVYGPPEWFE